MELEMSGFEYCLTGVVFGILVTVLFYWLKNRKIYTALKATQYSGISVAGEWAGKLIANEYVYWDLQLSIQQVANTLKGTFTTVKYINNAADKTTLMDITGETLENFILLNCKNKLGEKVSFGSMILKLSNAGLNGTQLFRNVSLERKDIVAMDVSFQSMKKQSN